VTIWALLDAARRPQWAWSLAGRSQAGWMAAIMFGVLTVVGGLCISAWYLTRIRPLVAAAEEGDVA
jgi:ABC-type Mn2+/Zn2+ transport system permease subunit